MQLKNLLLDTFFDTSVSCLHKYKHKFEKTPKTFTSSSFENCTIQGAMSLIRTKCINKRINEKLNDVFDNFEQTLQYNCIFIV